MANENLGLGGVQNPFLQNGANSYLQDIINLSSQDLVRNWNTAALPAFNAGMVKSGSFGNSGVDEMTRLGQQDLQKSLGDVSSKYRFNDYTQRAGLYGQERDFLESQRRYDQNFGRDTFNDAFGQNQENLRTGLGLLDWMGNRTGIDQQNAGAIYDAPLGYTQRIGQIGTAIGGMGGSTTGQVGTSSSPVTGALGGAQLASSWWNSRPSSSSSSSISQPNQDAFESFGSSNGWWGTA